MWQPRRSNPYYRVIALSTRVPYTHDWECWTLKETKDLIWGLEKSGFWTTIEVYEIATRDITNEL